MRRGRWQDGFWRGLMTAAVYVVLWVAVFPENQQSTSRSMQLQMAGVFVGIWGGIIALYALGVLRPRKRNRPGPDGSAG